MVMFYEHMPSHGWENWGLAFTLNMIHRIHLHEHARKNIVTKILWLRAALGSWEGRALITLDRLYFFVE